MLTLAKILRKPNSTLPVQILRSLNHTNVTHRHPHTKLKTLKETASYQRAPTPAYERVEATKRYERGGKGKGRSSPRQADTPFTKRHLNIWPVHTGTMAGAVKEKTFYNP